MVKKKMTPLLLACTMIRDITGACPNDKYDFEVNGGCEAMCSADLDAAECWKEYFYKKAWDST